jgi:hypothetical protein
MTAGRRPLTFTSLGQVMPDVERLLAGHTTVGRWSLGQICNHLELAIRLPMDGVPVKWPWLFRRTVGPVLGRLALWRGRIPEGVRVPEVYLPVPELDAAREAEALRTTIERFASFTGRLDEHPLLGRMSAARWERFHCLHCAHHLSFAIPADAPV